MRPERGAPVIWLLALLVIVVAGTGLRAALRPAGVELNHVVLFSLGLGFYWILPVVAGLARVLAHQPGLSLWYGTWDAAAQSGALTGFVVFALVVYLAFVSGDWVGSRLRLRASHATAPAPPTELPRDPRLLYLFLAPALGITVLYAWQLRSQLFAGYQFEVSAEHGMRGTLSACSLVLLALCLLRAVESDRWPRPALPAVVRVLLDPFLLAYALSAVLVLSLGGRLYVVSAILTGLVFVTVYRRPIPVGRALVIGVSALVLAGAAGTLRMGRAPTLLGIAVNVLAEPLFTSFSLLHFLAQGDAPWLTVPRFLLGDFLNLVPSAVFPAKGQYLLDPADFGYQIFSPLGALNSYVSFTINFGLLGTPPVMFLLGAGLAVLKRRATSLSRVSYAMLSGWLAFTFFRDAFSISVVKNMFEFSVLVPALLVWCMHVLTVVAPRRPSGAAASGVRPAGASP